MVVPVEYDFGLLRKHYDAVKFVPRKRYTLMTPFLAFNYPEGFISEYEFRSELYRKKPIFIANSPPDNEVVIDVDYRIEEFTREKFEEVTTIANIIAGALEKVIPVDEIKFRFSGRGIHIVAITDVIETANNIRVEKGLRKVKDARALLNEYIFIGLKGLFEWNTIKEYVDKSNLSSNKIYRTPLSLNDKTMLPVVEFKRDEEITLEKIINSVTKPRTFFVTFTKRVVFREGEVFKRGKYGYVDEYELLRLLIKDNFHIETIKEV